MEGQKDVEREGEGEAERGEEEGRQGGATIQKNLDGPKP